MTKTIDSDAVQAIDSPATDHTPAVCQPVAPLLRLAQAAGENAISMDLALSMSRRARGSNAGDRAPRVSNHFP